MHSALESEGTYCIARIHIMYTYVYLLLENKKIFELKNEGYRDGIKRKETR